jgi:hypothetical protein
LRPDELIVASRRLFCSSSVVFLWPFGTMTVCVWLESIFPATAARYCVSPCRSMPTCGDTEFKGIKSPGYCSLLYHKSNEKAKNSGGNTDRLLMSTTVRIRAWSSGYARRRRARIGRWRSSGQRVICSGQRVARSLGGRSEARW